jgi:hypothetical protein
MKVTECQPKFLILDINSHSKRHFPVLPTYALEPSTWVGNNAIAYEYPRNPVFILENGFSRIEVFRDPDLGAIKNLFFGITWSVNYYFKCAICICDWLKSCTT